MKTLKYIIIIFIFVLLLTGCINSVDKEYAMKINGKYTIYEYKTPGSVIYSKEELKKDGIEGYMEFKENYTGAYYQGNQRKDFTYDEDYIYYKSDNSKDTYEYKDGNIVLISEKGGRLTFVKE